MRGAKCDVRQVHCEALKLTFDLERPDAGCDRVAFRHMPETVYPLLRRVFPMLTYTLTKRRSWRNAAAVQRGQVPDR